MRFLSIGTREPAVDTSAWVAPGAVVIGDVTLGARVGVWYGCTLRADTEAVRIGADSNVQDGTIIHADPGEPSVIGERVTLGHGVLVHGATVEDDCLVGMRSTILNGARVGAGSVIGAGALVTPGTHIPPGSLALGAPARVVRPANDADRAEIAETSREYVGHAERHRDEARPWTPPTPAPGRGAARSPEDRLAELGITLPALEDGAAAYEPSTSAGTLLWISGQLPEVDGRLLETGTVGRGPGQISPERAAELARVCAINALATVADRVGTLDRIRSIPKVMAFVASDPSFTEHSAVINGFSTLLTEVLGEAGKHARSAVGVAGLPLGSPVEVEAIFEIE